MQKTKTFIESKTAFFEFHKKSLQSVELLFNDPAYQFEKRDFGKTCSKFLITHAQKLCLFILKSMPKVTLFSKVRIKKYCACVNVFIYFCELRRVCYLVFLY